MCVNILGEGAIDYFDELSGDLRPSHLLFDPS